MTRSAFHHDPRAVLSDRDRAKLFLERGGRCHCCSRKLRPGDDWIAEHVTALENGGTNAWSNLDITCTWCKPEKDASDHAKAAHAKRVAVRHVLPGKRRRKSLTAPAGMKFDWQQGRYRR